MPDIWRSSTCSLSNAGIATCAPIDELNLSDWERNFAVNSTGHFLVARAGIRLFKAQGIGGNIVFVATKNVVAPGKDFGAYSASKAAEAQLGRGLSRWKEGSSVSGQTC